MQLSPWRHTPFRDVRGRRYPTVGHYIMAHKALLQNDKRAHDRVMRSRCPFLVPTQSRAWERVRLNIAYDAIRYMMQATPSFREELLATGMEDIIDRTMEYGIDVRDNLLGRAAMNVRMNLYPSIIVPYRATDQPERKQQLDVFRAHMAKHLPWCPLIVVEQRPGEPFNRGALLNKGVRHAVTEKVCLHDVDLLPGKDILGAYLAPLYGVRHIARAWKRYNYDKYMGGIVLMWKRDYERINGIPNDFWGWGGEDDELSARIEDNQIPVERVTSGTITDQENLDLKTKMSILRENGFKCNDKWEKRAWHRARPGLKGYRDVQDYDYLSTVL